MFLSEGCGGGKYTGFGIAGSMVGSLAGNESSVLIWFQQFVCCFDGSDDFH
jgi:hypothetical protein